jgi:threonylcarbamoyladenosine tRNA methylthiotransferase MtaB
MTNKSLTFSIYSLGCKLNYAESNTIRRKLIDAGFKEVSYKSPADICIIHSCAVTQQAEKKSRHAIHKAQKLSPGAIIVAAGCLSQLYPEKMIKNTGIHLILGNKEKYDIVDHINNAIHNNKTQVFRQETTKLTQFVNSYSVGGRTRSYLKIQDGCDYFCSYCTIPHARGRSRNGSIKSLVEQARVIAGHGGKEIILTGVNIGDFGKSTNETFLELIKALEKVEGITRYRISSLEPDLISDEIIDFVASSNKFAPHFHIPLQSGSVSMLKAMKRRYNIKSFTKLIEKINQNVQDVCIGVDVIVGFPGETSALFDETYTLLSALDIAYLHVFSFSERVNTRAAGIENKISPEAIANRSKTLQNLSDEKRTAYYQKYIGSTKNILFESKVQDGRIFGFTENYIKTETISDEHLIGQVVMAELKSINEHGNVTILM